MPPPFPRTLRSLSLDRSRYALPLFAAAVALLGGWGVWAVTARVALPGEAPAAGGAGGRASISPAALLLRAKGRASAREAGR